MVLRHYRRLTVSWWGPSTVLLEVDKALKAGSTASEERLGARVGPACDQQCAFGNLSTSLSLIFLHLHHVDRNTCLRTL